MFESFADYLVYQRLAFSPNDPFGAALQFFLADMPKLVLLLTCSIFIISVIRSYIPAAKTKDFLTRRGQGAGHVLAALIGIITPFCSCSAVPLFIGFIEAGVPLGVTFSFLVSSPMVNEVALILLFGLFGWKVALLYMASGVMIAILAGFIIGRLQLEHLLESYAPATATTNTVEFHSFSQRCQSAGTFTIELLRYILPYLTIAIAIGGFIHAQAKRAQAGGHHAQTVGLFHPQLGRAAHHGGALGTGGGDEQRRELVDHVRHQGFGHRPRRQPLQL